MVSEQTVLKEGDQVCSTSGILVHKDKVKTSYSWCLTSALARWTEMRSLANWLKLLSLKPSSHSRCSSALSSSLFHGAALPPSPATPTPASLQVTSIPPPLQHPHQHPYRSPLYPLPPLQHPYQHPYRSPLYPPLPATPTPASQPVVDVSSMLTGVSLFSGVYVQPSNQPRHAHAAFPQLYNPTSHVRPSQTMSENIKHQRKT